MSNANSMDPDQTQSNLALQTITANDKADDFLANDSDPAAVYFALTNPPIQQRPKYGLHTCFGLCWMEERRGSECYDIMHVSVQPLMHHVQFLVNGP